MPVSVTGPDQRNYQFPDGTTKEQAIAYFKKKGIGAAPAPGQTGLPTAQKPATPPQPGQTGLPTPLGQPGPSGDPDFELMSEKAPEGARFPILGRTGYDIADALSKTLPPIGSIVGEVAMAPSVPFTGIWGPVGGAVAGAMGGERLQRGAEHVLYKDLQPEKASDVAYKMLLQGGMGLASKWSDLAVNAFMRPLLENLPLARTAWRTAEEGRGIRKTPGEAGGSKMLTRAESVAEHRVGGSREMEEFRAKQVADIHEQVRQRLEALSDRHLTPEDVGKEVQDIFTNAKAQLDPEVAQGLGEVENELQQRIQNLMHTRLTDLSPQAMTAEETGKGIQTLLRDEQSSLQKATERDLQRLREVQQQNVNSLFSREFDALHPIARTSEDTGAAIQGNLRAQQDAAQAKLKTNLDNVRTTQQTNVNKVLNQELHALSPEELSREQAGQKVQGELRDLERNSVAVRNAKYEEVKKLALKGAKTDEERELLKPGGYIPKDRLDVLAARDPEAKAKLEEADLLFVQEHGRFDIPIVQKLMGSRPEDISAFLAKASLEDLRTLKRYLPANVFQNAARELLDSYIYTATKRGVVSAESLANSLKDLREDKGRIIFGANYDTIKNSVGMIDGINASADRAAERYTTQATAPFASELTQDILKGRAEKVGTMMSTASLEDLRAFKNQVPQDMQQAAARDVLESIVKNARDKDGIINGKKLAKSLSDLDDGRGRLIFGDRYDSIKAAGAEFNRINEATEASALNVQQRSSSFDLALFRNIVKPTTPAEKVIDLVQAAGYDELRQLRQRLSPEQLQSLRHNIFESVINSARDKEHPEIIDPKKFATALAKVGGDRGARGEIIFGDEWDKLVQSQRVVTRLEEVAEQNRGIVTAKSKQFNTALVKQVIDTNNPETIAGLLTAKQTSPEDLYNMMKELPPETRWSAARNVLEDFIKPARVDPRTFELNPAELANSLNNSLLNLGETRGRIIFGREYENIADLARELKKISYSESPHLGKMHMSAWLTGLVGLATGTLVKGPIAGLATGAFLQGADIGAMKLLAWIVTHPQYSLRAVQLLRGTAYVVGRGGIPIWINEHVESSPAEHVLGHEVPLYPDIQDQQVPQP